MVGCLGCRKLGLFVQHAASPFPWRSRELGLFRVLCLLATQPCLARAELDSFCTIDPLVRGGSR